MDKYFALINKYLFSLLNNEEILKVGMWGENSQFIRLNMVFACTEQNKKI